MIAFLILAALMIGVALAFVLVPLMRRHRDTAAAGDSERRRRALDEARELGLVDEAEYEAKLAKIGTVASTPSTRRRGTFAAVLGVALLLPASALFLYRLVGTPQALDPKNLAAESGHTMADMQQAIDNLAAKLKQNPDDARGWALLARAYQATNRFAESRDAFREAHQRTPDDNDLTVEYAQSIALAEADHRIDGEPRRLLDGVLAKDPNNQRALWLVGISDYQDAKYDDAIATWKKLLALIAPDSDVARSVRAEIADAEAKRDGKAPPAMPAPEAPAAATAASNAPAETSGASLTVEVRLDPKLADRVTPDETLFVFARADQGPPMPLAIRRMKAGDLPATVTLDDSMGMMPSMKLSKFPKVVVGARISKSGNAMPASGDLQTLSPPVDVHRSAPIALTIDRVVP